jgi:hypothetical protein
VEAPGAADPPGVVEPAAVGEPPGAPEPPDAPASWAPGRPGRVRWLPRRRSVRIAAGALAAACAASVAVALGGTLDDGNRGDRLLGDGHSGPSHHAAGPGHPTAGPHNRPPRRSTGTSDDPGPPVPATPSPSGSLPAPLMASPTPGGPRSSTVPAALLALCRTYLSSGSRPSALTPADLRKLEQAAGGQERITHYCEHAVAVAERGLPGG